MVRDLICVAPARSTPSSRRVAHHGFLGEIEADEQPVVVHAGYGWFVGALHPQYQTVGGGHRPLEGDEGPAADLADAGGAGCVAVPGAEFTEMLVEKRLKDGLGAIDGGEAHAGRYERRTGGGRTSRKEGVFPAIVEGAKEQPA
jgi:hypothetical protein